jgi:hypothetical protein
MHLFYDLSKTPEVFPKAAHLSFCHQKPLRTRKSIATYQSLSLAAPFWSRTSMIIVLLLLRESDRVLRGVLVVDGVILVLPQCLSLLENSLAPFLNLLELDTSSNPRELSQVQLEFMFLLILYHLQNQLNLVNVVNKLALQSHSVLVLLLDSLDLVTSHASIDSSQQAVDKVVHSCTLAAILLSLCNAINRCNISNQGFRHVVNQCHLRAAMNINSRSECGRSKHSNEEHAVHVVRDGFAAV